MYVNNHSTSDKRHAKVRRGSTGGIYFLGMKVTDSITKERAFSWARRDDRNLPDGKRWEGVSKQSKQQKDNNRGEKVSHTFREQWEAR